jgi:2-polyprenyl-3-methyl-5-hydroxy-6-metoxy-1,4-benzoquinol methylase
LAAQPPLLEEEGKKEMGHKYDYAIDLNDDSAPARVVRMVGEGKRVLELGAGPGSMARVLRDTFNCRVTAIEIDNEVIDTLEPFCDRVYRVDLNDPSWAQALQNETKFDVVVVADVLEHLYDPWSALPRIKEFLAPDGYVVVSLPHTGHNSIIACLLNEDFEYRNAGLLDKTHIRFFGMKNIQALFDNSGLAIADAQFVIRFPESTEFGEAWDRVPAPIRTRLLENKFGLVYQVVIKAVRTESTNQRVSLLDMPVDKSPDSPVNVEQPLTRRSPENEAAAKVRLLAFFLPQFHPTPENNLWWGKGFTEWTNVTKAEPLFEGHYQPHLPADLGFYDLRLRDVRHEQIALAKQYGLDGFCYYYYWFSGTRILNAPLDDMLADNESDMPFCLCWANENWTRRWDGADHEVLIAQKYLPNDDIDFIKSLIPFFKDARYIRLGGAPFLIVYQPQRLPDPRKTVDTWREYCREIGIGKIHVCAALTNENENYAKLGFDSGLQFPPHNRRCPNVNDLIDFYTPFHGCVVEYEALAQFYLDHKYQHANVFRTVCPSWDQTARVGSRAFIALNGTPANYEYWLSESIRRTAEDFPGQERFVFINAWNEWAEGCHLEPDRRFQRRFLEATLQAKTNRSDKKSFEDTGLPKIVGPFTSLQARFDELRQELSIGRQRLATAEQDLGAERQRLSEVYREIASKRTDLVKLEQEISNESRKVSALNEELTLQRQKVAALNEQVSLQQQQISALNEQLSALKHEMGVIHESVPFRISRALRSLRRP